MILGGVFKKALPREDLFRRKSHFGDVELAEGVHDIDHDLTVGFFYAFDYQAEVLDYSLSATKSLIHRGREYLKEKLKPYLQTGDWKDWHAHRFEFTPPS